MKVLRINDFLGEPGGAEAYIAQISRLLDQRGHPQKVFTVSNVQSLVRYTPLPWEEVFPARPLGLQRIFEDIFDDPALTLRLNQILQEFQPDLIHLHHFDNLFTPVARFLTSVDVPLVMTAHDAKLFCPLSTLRLPDGRDCEGGVLPRCQFTGCNVGRGLPYKMYQSRFFRDEVQPHVRYFLAPSRSTIGLLEAHGFRPTRHLPSFIREPTTLPPLSYADPIGPPTVGILTRLHMSKGVHTVLEAFAQVQKTLPSARLVIAGRGPAEGLLKTRTKELHLEGAVDFPGWLEGRRKEAFFRRIHILAVPSIAYENFPLVSMEAMSRCKPVLGSRNGGIPDLVVDGETGKMLPPADVDAWAQAMLEILPRPDVLRRWGLAGRSRYEAHFRPENHVKGLLEVYGSLLPGAGAA